MTSHSYKDQLQNDVVNYLRHLLHWRKKSNAICKGTMKHYIPQNSIYVYFREYADEKVMIVSNGASSTNSIYWECYSEDLCGYDYGIEVISKQNIAFTNEEMRIKGNTVLIVELKRH